MILAWLINPSFQINQEISIQASSKLKALDLGGTGA
jgi:hypothetical protein